MRIAVTGATGTVGSAVVAHALKHGHSVVGIDIAPRQQEPQASEADADIVSRNRYTFIQADLKNFDQVLSAISGCDGVAHLAALRTPGDGRDATHNNNVVVSWNVLRAAAELGITKIAQASSINVIGLYWNQNPPQIDYLPLDEAHPCRPDDPYSLSKQICEAQADAIARRYRRMRIASLRIHMVVPTRERAINTSAKSGHKQLWGYTLESSCASAFLLALISENPDFEHGHERFFVVEPDVASNEDVNVLVEKTWVGVPVREELKGKGLFDCSKAEKLLGWRHG